MSSGENGIAGWLLLSQNRVTGMTERFCLSLSDTTRRDIRYNLRDYSLDVS